MKTLSDLDELMIRLRDAEWGMLIFTSATYGMTPEKMVETLKFYQIDANRVGIDRVMVKLKERNNA